MENSARTDQHEKTVTLQIELLVFFPRCISGILSVSMLRPDFLLTVVTLSSLTRLSLLKAAHVDVGECHVQEIRANTRSGKLSKLLAITALGYIFHGI
jgi:hypothetical protein